MGSGYLQGIDILRQFFDKDSMLHGDPNRHASESEILENIQYDFISWLGESKYMHGLNTIPPSRFSNTNANGLWEYSPFLCGAGLKEALELAYILGVMIWDRIPEVVLLIHIHNMLVERGYLSRPVGLYNTLAEVFPNAFFLNGKPPTSGFSHALEKLVSKTTSLRFEREPNTTAQTAARTGADLHEST
jgi:hypothetical protein